jgi:hypothetical protein
LVVSRKNLDSLVLDFHNNVGNRSPLIYSSFAHGVGGIGNRNPSRLLTWMARGINCKSQKTAQRTGRGMNLNRGPRLCYELLESSALGFSINENAMLREKREKCRLRLGDIYATLE